MYTSLIGAALNIVLNMALIPPLGIVGAALASTLSLGAVHALNSVQLYRISTIHPFSKHYLKPIILSILVLIPFYVIVSNLLTVTFWMLPVLFVLLLAVYPLALLLTKSFEQEDIKLLLAIEERLGINAAPIKRILRRFM